MQKFHTGDKVKVIAGKDKGREGVIEKLFPKKAKALVPDLNMYKKHVKGTQGNKGGIYDVPRPFDLAKLAIVCPKCKKQTRIGFKIVGSEKVRFCKKCKKELTSQKK